MKNTENTMMMGSSYYPERWGKNRWSVDAKLMREAGFSFIRTGEFAWSKFESDDGVFDFTWMDEAIGVFESFGIKIIMCTPTASPMPWISTKHPDILPVTEEGKIFGPGQRRHYCFNNISFGHYTERIVRRMAEHYSKNKSIIGWQIDNELGGEEFICCCESCKLAFRLWLKSKYESLQELNNRWGGTFFSLEFTDWDQIPVPMGHNVRFYNPSFKKDYLQFYSDSMKDFLYFQEDILKEYIKNVPITTNRYTLFWTDKYDHRMDKNLDVVGFDNYDLDPSLASYHHDFYRSIKKDRKYWVLEQNCGLTEYGLNQKEIMHQTIQSFAKGAELVCYFSWRQINYGCEQDSCGGVVDNDGTTGETYEILKETNKWIEENAHNLLNLKLKNSIAILYSYESCMMYYTNHMFNNINYQNEVYNIFYKPVFELGLGIDFIHNFEDIGNYNIVIIPLHMHASEEGICRIREHINSGGIVIITGDFMQKSSDNWRLSNELYKEIDELLGIKRDKILFANICKEAKVKSTLTGNEYTMHGFFNKFSLVDPEIKSLVNVVSPEMNSNNPIVIEKTLGKGKIIYFAGIPDEGLSKELIREYAIQSELEVFDLPKKVEILKFYNNEEDKLCSYLINNRSEQFIKLKFNELEETIAVEAGEIKIISLQK